MKVTKTITLRNGETYIVDIVKEADVPGLPRRYEVSCSDGIPTGETVFGDDSPTYAWSSPCQGLDEAIETFIDMIERLRQENNYYTSGAVVK